MKNLLVVLALLGLVGCEVTPSERRQVAEARWQQVENKANCAVWNPHPQQNETVTWTGDCVNGIAQGRGTKVWRYWEDGEWKEHTYEGDIFDGRRHGRGVYVYANCNRYDGELKDGKLTGLNTPKGGKKGNWRVSDNGVLCARWELAGDSKENCDAMRYLGKKQYKWGGSTFVILKGNPKGL